MTLRDINVVSAWAEASWEEVAVNGYFDGKRPGETITWEEAAVVMNRLRINFLKLIAGVDGDIKECWMNDSKKLKGRNELNQS